MRSRAFERIQALRHFRSNYRRWHRYLAGWGKPQVHVHPRPLFAIEPLEQRVMLSGAVPSNVFAQIDETIDDPADRPQVVITVSPDDFTLAGGSTLVGFHARASDGSNLNPGITQVRTNTGSPVKRVLKRSNSAGTKDSLTIAKLSQGDYSLALHGQNRTTGDVQVQLYLVGDANGDRIVDNTDTALIRGLLGTKSSDANYVVEADADRNGKINKRDLRWAKRNLGDEVTLQPASQQFVTSGPTDSPPVTVLPGGIPGTPTPAVVSVAAALGDALIVTATAIQPTVIDLNPVFGNDPASPTLVFTVTGGGGVLIDAVLDTNGTDLILTPVAGQSGTADITVTATHTVTGQVGTDSFTVTVADPLELEGFNNNVNLFVAPDGFVFGDASANPVAAPWTAIVDATGFVQLDGTLSGGVALQNQVINLSGLQGLLVDARLGTGTNSGSGVFNVVLTDADGTERSFGFSIATLNTSGGGFTTLAASLAQAQNGNAGANSVLDLDQIVKWQISGDFSDSVDTISLQVDSLQVIGTVPFINSNPTIDPQIFTVDEDSTNGTNVGTVLANDPDPGDTLTFSIISGNGTGSGVFAIDPLTGQLTVADANQLDSLTTPSYALIVQVQDILGLTATATITVNVTPSGGGTGGGGGSGGGGGGSGGGGDDDDGSSGGSGNSTPTVAAAIADQLVNEDAVPIALDLSGTFTDADGDNLILSVASNDNAVLVGASLSGTVLTLTFAPDQNGQAIITVQATDPAGAFVEDSFIMTVNAVNDTPVIVTPITNIVEQINALPTVLDLSTNFSDVDIATNGDVLTLSVLSNTNLGLISTVVNGTDLMLSYAPGQSGSADITVQATDLSGAFVQNTFTVTIPSVTVEIGSDDTTGEPAFPRSITFTDPSGAIATISLNIGTATLIFDGGTLDNTLGKKRAVAIDGSAQLIDILLDGTTTRSKLTIRVKGDNVIEVRDIVSSRSMREISGDFDLLGNLTVNGGLNRLRLHDVRGGHAISIGTTPVQDTTLTFIAHDVIDTRLTSGIPVKSLQVNQWIDRDGLANDSILAPWLNKAKVLSDFAPDLTLNAINPPSRSLQQIIVGGQIGASLWDIARDVGSIVSGSVAPGWSAVFLGHINRLVVKRDASGDITAKSIATFVVGGRFSNAKLTLTGTINTQPFNLGRLRVRDVIDHVELRSTGHINSITARGLNHSLIFAGVQSAVATLPSSANDFPIQARLNSLRLKPIKDSTAMVDTHIAAWTIGNVRLGRVRTNNLGIRFGVAANTISKIRYSNLNGQTTKRTKLTHPDAISDGDFDIRLICCPDEDVAPPTPSTPPPPRDPTIPILPTTPPDIVVVPLNN